METVKILHCADVHIGAAESFLGTVAQSRRYDTLITFEKIIAAAKEENVQFLLIAGDLLDSNNIEKSFVTRILASIASIPETQVIFAAGNHDPITLASPFLSEKLPTNFHIMPTYDSVISFDECRVRIYGKSFSEIYDSGEPLFSITPDDEYINIMCLHADNAASSQYNAITENFVFKSGMDYVALGHIHRRSDIMQAGTTPFSYCGCPEGHGFDELGEKGVYIGEIGKGVCNLKFMPLSKRRYELLETDITDVSDADAIAKKILSDMKENYGDTFAENLYKIVLTGKTDENTDINVDEIKSRIGDAVYYAKIKDKTSPAVDLTALAEENTLKGLFAKNMLKRISDAAPEEKEILENSLLIGLKAFKSEVTISEDQ